ncbi:MAG: nucleotidyltransferase domain-containing protein [Desulfurococcales archaeon]|nr:nucleotidyltransferase domain-containing protein [Desulfurococcales archaeon]
MSVGAVDREVLGLIRRVVLDEARRLGVEVERVILFGSRARGDARPDSDWDILVVVEGRIDRRRKTILAAGVGATLTRLLGSPVDVVVVSGDYWRRYKGLPGTILYPAAVEGVAIV